MEEPTMRKIAIAIAALAAVGIAMPLTTSVRANESKVVIKEGERHHHRHHAKIVIKEGDRHHHRDLHRHHKKIVLIKHHRRHHDDD
jgi:Ni/Co efflux regulator RcnB